MGLYNQTTKNKKVLGMNVKELVEILVVVVYFVVVSLFLLGLSSPQLEGAGFIFDPPTCGPLLLPC